MKLLKKKLCTWLFLSIVGQMNTSQITFKSRIKRITTSIPFSIFVVLVVLCVVLSIVNPTFISINNLQSVTRAFSYIAIMAIGELLVILTGKPSSLMRMVPGILLSYRKNLYQKAMSFLRMI